MSFKNILETYKNISFSERDKGERFERLMQAYLKTDPKYANLFKEVWMWNDFPQKVDFGGKDIGIDLVALTNDGDYWAIQSSHDFRYTFVRDQYQEKTANGEDNKQILKYISKELNHSRTQMTKFYLSRI